jgi:predicted dehydrogenase
MKALFCGMGSIGKRHVTNLKKVVNEMGLSCEIDALRSTDRPLERSVSRLLRRSFKSMDEADGVYDMAFVTNPTAMHEGTLRALAGRAAAVFVEKPVFGGVVGDIDALGLGDAVCYVACPLRRHPVVARMREIALEGGVFSARAVSSSYLPSWRPGSDYRECYSARRALGGGVALDLIHEWDYLTWMFGPPDRVAAMRGHFSQLEIDSDDVAEYIARYPDMLLSLRLDYIGRVPERGVVLYRQDEVIAGDILAGTVTFRRTGRVENCGEADIHLEEMRYFVGCALEGNRENMNTLPRALETLKIALCEVW